MKDWKTSLIGWVMVIAMVALLLAHTLGPVFKGDFAGALKAALEYWPAVMTALGGVGLIHAADAKPTA